MTSPAAARPTRRRPLRCGSRAATVGSLFAALALAMQAGPARAMLFAGRIDAANASEVLVGGPDAIGGIDDWALRNGTLCAVVTDPAHEGYLMPSGGSLVDLGFCGREDDQFIVLEVIANLSRDASVRWSRVRAETTDAEAALVVEGEREGLRIETRYALDELDPKRLRITTRVRREAEGARLSSFGDVNIHYEGTLRPFTLARHGRSEGYSHVATGDAGLLELAGAIVPVESVLLIGPHIADRPISYGLRLVDARVEESDGSSQPVPTFGLSTETVTVMGAFVRPFWVGDDDDIGLLQLAQSYLMDLDEEQTLVFEREIRVEPTLDGTPFTDRLHVDAPVVRGSVDARRARIHVRDPSGASVASIAPGTDGHFALRLPRGRYSFEVRADGGRVSKQEVEVTTDPTDIGELPLAAAAWIELPPEVAPARLVFRGEAGTPDPDFEDDLLDFRSGGRPMPAHASSHDIHLGGFPGDPTRVAIAPGRYRVYAMRGLEFGVTQTTFEISAGEVKPLALDAPQRAVATPGWIAADLHVHAAPSDDSTVPLRLRVATFLAEGGEVLVSTDHDQVSDYAPLIRAYGLRERLRSVAGLEVTSTVATEAAPFTAGHSNVFPLVRQPTISRGGALRSEGRRLRDIVAEARARPGERIVQLNHPRGDGDGTIENEGAFFSHLSIGKTFDPAQAISAPTNASLIERDPETGLRDIDIDAVELMNGPSAERYRRIREDWFSLLRQGYRITGTANSDTHSLHAIVAVPRTYVRMQDDAPAAFDEAAFVESLKKGAVSGTTGPLLEVALVDAAGREAGPGGRSRGGDATLRVAVRTAPWVPVSTLRIRVDGTVVDARAISGPADVALPMHFDADAFVTVEAEGAPDALYSTLLPGFTPLAFTNPIFVDADDDGVWRAPLAAQAISPAPGAAQ